MSLSVELWQDAIKETLFKANPHMDKCLIRDEYVLEGAVVHIPQAGAPADVVKNRSSVPATPVQRTDTEITYAIDELTTDPWFMPDRDLYELSYDKQMSMLKENMGNMNQYVGDNLFYSWAKNVPTEKKIDTTGAENILGNKSITQADLIMLQNVLNNDNVPRDGRYLAVTSNQLMDFLNDSSLKQYFAINPINLAEGTVGKMFGFNIIERTSVIRTNSSKVAKDPWAADAGGDLTDVALFWQETAVERAIGSIKAFEDIKNPLYYANLYSLLVRVGGRNTRGDNKGVGMLVSVAA